MTRETLINKRVKEHYCELIKRGYDVFLVSLYGSQNYGLDLYTETYKSDIDTKAIIIPSINDVFLGKQPISHTIELENGEHIDVKDIREMFRCYRKQNINFVETLFTDFYVVNPLYETEVRRLLDNRELIASYDWNATLSCIMGMCFEKEKKLLYQAPATEKLLEKFGYDPKQFHHILRMKYFLIKLLNGNTYKDCLTPTDRDLLLETKEGKFSKDEAILLARKTTEEVKALRDINLRDTKPNKTVDDLLDNLIIDLFSKVARR